MLIGLEQANNPPCCEVCNGELSWSEKFEKWACVYCYELKGFQKFTEAGLSSRFYGKAFADYIPCNQKAKKVLEACIDYAENFTPGISGNLVMIGSPGTGKNMLTAIIGQTLIQKGFIFQQTTAMRCVRKVKDAWKEEETAEQDVIDSFVVPDCLALDEIGVQFNSQTEQMYLTEIINDRYEKRRPMIMISNLTVDQIEKAIGVRALDRFYEDGSKFLVLDWPSYRRQ